MTENFFRTAQVAKLVGCSPHLIRRLCEAGLVSSEQTAAGHLRIPQKEVERLQREGLPPIPTTAVETDPVQTSPRQSSPAPAAELPKPVLLSEPSLALIESAEEVAKATNYLKKRKIDREMEETEDFFRDREQRVAEQREQAE